MAKAVVSTKRRASKKISSDTPSPAVTTVSQPTFWHRIQTLWANPKTHLILGAALCIFFAVAYAVMMVNKYWQLEYFFVDNVYFHSSLWKLAQFENPIVTHPYLGQINIFGDHFHPSIILVALLFKIFPWHATIFISMAVLYSLGGWFAFLIGRKLLKNKITLYVLMLAYFLYIGTQNAFIFGFHEINLLSPFFFLSLWGLIEKKLRVYWFGFILLLLTKESMAVIGIGISIFAWLLGKEYRKVAVATLVASLGWYLAVTKVIIPYFSGGRFLYGNIDLPDNLPQLAERLVKPEGKIETFLVSVSSFGFLPLLNIPALPLVLQDFMVRYIFAIPGNVQYLLTYHYGVALAPMLLFSSLWSVHVLERFKWGKWVIVGCTLLTLGGTFYGNFMLSQRAPIFLVFNPGFYATTTSNQFLWPLINNTPWDGTVMTQNHLGLPLSQRPTLMLSKTFSDLLKAQPDYLVYDLRDGQNPNNYFPSTEADWKQIVIQATSSGQYKESYRSGDLYILKRQ